MLIAMQKQIMMVRHGILQTVEKGYEIPLLSWGAVEPKQGDFIGLDNFDEIQDFEHDIRERFGGRGFLSDEEYSLCSDPLGTSKGGLSLRSVIDNLSSITIFNHF